MSAGLFPLAAIDVGNSRVKFAVYDKKVSGTSIPELAPDTFFEFDPRDGGWERFASRLETLGTAPAAWWIGSVERRVAARLIELLRDRNLRPISLVTSVDLPLVVDLPRPDMVGIDRLLGAVAANRLRTAGRPAVVVGMGTAVTINLIGPDGAFRGGAILPGIGMSARALHAFTDMLPLIDMHALTEPPPAVGDATIPAMTSGLFWGAVGGVRQLIELFGRHVGGEPEVFLTGGAAPSVAKLFGEKARYEPTLVLDGIALAASSKT